MYPPHFGTTRSAQLALAIGYTAYSLNHIEYSDFVTWNELSFCHHHSASFRLQEWRARSPNTLGAPSRPAVCGNRCAAELTIRSTST